MTRIAGSASLGSDNAALAPETPKPEAATQPAEAAPEPDAKFRELLDRVNLQTGRLQFLLEAWNAESANVKSAIDAVESSDEIHRRPAGFHARWRQE